MQTAMEQLQKQMADMATASSQRETDVEAKMQELHNRLQAKEAEIQGLQATTASSHGGVTAERSSLVQKWAPDSFSGERKDWMDWAVKCRSCMGAMLSGQVAQWLEQIEKDRETSARIVVLGESARSCAGVLHSALIATCQGTALTIVRRAGSGEGLEAWRELVRKYEPRSKQTKVMRLIEVLSFSFKEGQLLDSLERFEATVAEYEKEAGSSVPDDLKVGVVIKGIEKGSLKEHLLLQSERCDTYESFRAELDVIARAQSIALFGPSPMDIDAFSKGGKGGGGKGADKFTGKCDNCGKTGHKKAQCWAKGGGAAQGGKGGGKGGKGDGGSGGGGKGGPAKKACHKCGMTNHLAADCRASAEKQKRYQAQKGHKSFREVNDEEEPEPASGNLGEIGLCELEEQASWHVVVDKKRQKRLRKSAGQRAEPCAGRGRGEETNELCEVSDKRVRTDGSNRVITFAIDSAACTTVVPTQHEAARGYKVWKDQAYGRTYGTAKKGGSRIKDEGKRILQTKIQGGELPKRLTTRVADVHRPLMAVGDMVDKGHAVLFDAGGSYAMNKKTGVKTPFVRKGKGWEVAFDLEAPETANEVSRRIIAEMTEAKAAQSQPTIELNILKGNQYELLANHEPEDNIHNLGFQWAARPQGRA